MLKTLKELYKFQYWSFAICIIVCLSSCKTSRVVVQKATVTEPVTIEKDTTYLITQKGDTLSSLSDSVALSLSRILKDTITIAAVGDMMMGTDYPSKSYLPPDSGSTLWTSVKATLESADITFGNLEGTILDGEGDPKKCKNPKACFLFKTPTRLAYHLAENGFDLLSIANNHANDFGKEGRKSTQQVLDSLGIHHAGSIEQAFSIKKIKGAKIGFAAFAPNIGTQSIHDRDRAKAIIQQLDSLCDFVIVSFHAGAEGSKNQHVTRKTEFYYGEDRGNVYDLSHFYIDHGADIILGHGPHVVRGIEVYKNRLIAYSLGNFLTYGRFNLKGPNALAPILEVKLTNTGEFVSGFIHSFRQSYDFGPGLDVKNRAAKRIQKLSTEDFPENPILVDDSGRILYIQN